MKRICVFCGSRPGGRDDYLAAATDVARYLAAQRIGVVYGGASVGTMERLADATLDAQGEVIGVIPRILADKGIAHGGLTQLYVVDSMRERKNQMIQLSDGFVALPGGLGTLQDLLELLTWAQLGMDHKPVGLLNVRGFYDRLLAFFDDCVTERFLTPADRELVLAADTPRSLVDRMKGYRANWLQSANATANLR